MTFPTVAATNAGGAGAGTSDVVLSLPGGAVAGDLVICVALISIISGTVAATGWTGTLSSISLGLGISHTFSVLSRIIDGTEGGIITIPRSSSAYLSAASYRITGWHGTTMPEAGYANAGSPGEPDPPSLSPSWGSADTLWIAAGVRKGNTATTLGYPTNYTANQVSAYDGGVSGRVLLATREVAASSENPSAFTIYNGGGSGVTIAVRPAASAGITSVQVDRGRALGRGIGRGL